RRGPAVLLRQPERVPVGGCDDRTVDRQIDQSLVAFTADHRLHRAPGAAIAVRVAVRGRQHALAWVDLFDRLSGAVRHLYERARRETVDQAAGGGRPAAE